MIEVAGKLVDGTLIGRRARFTAMVSVGGNVMPAHLPTSSRLGELLIPDTRIILADRMRPGRLTRYDLVMVETSSGLVSVDSLVPNRLISWALRNSALPEFEGWSFARAEAVCGGSRFDFLLAGPKGRCWVEVKSVTLVQDGTALFPDAVTMRGARHLDELGDAVDHGDYAAAVFVVQRGDAHRFAPNRPLDPRFADALARAASRGVDVYAYRCRVEPGRVSIDRRIECVIDGCPGG